MPTTLPLVFLGGLLGSSHCVGMCGGFALIVGMKNPGLRNNAIHQVLYSLGRIFTYAVLGGAAGFGGWRLTQLASEWTIFPALLSLAAGILLVVTALISLGWIPRNTHAPSGCLTGSFLSTLLRTPGLGNSFGAGMITGFLPCGLVYAFIALAGSSRDMLTGAALMATFGLGTVPLMLLTGVGAGILGIGARKRMLRLAAWSVLLTGLLTSWRGAAFLMNASSPPEENCPFCESIGEQET